MENLKFGEDLKFGENLNFGGNLKFRENLKFVLLTSFLFDFKLNRTEKNKNKNSPNNTCANRLGVSYLPPRETVWLCAPRSRVCCIPSFVYCPRSAAFMEVNPVKMIVIICLLKSRVV